MEGNSINIKLIVFLVFNLLILNSNAQSDLIFYHNYSQFASSTYNPANLNSQRKFTLSVFPLANSSIQFNNNEFFVDLYSKLLRGDSLKMQLNDVMNKLSNTKKVYQKFDGTLINLSFHAGFGAIDFRVGENIQALSNLEGNLSSFILHKGEQSIKIGQPQRFAAEAFHVREYSLGYANDFYDKRLSVGTRAKLYFGKSALYSDVQGNIVEQDGAVAFTIGDPLRLSIPVKLNLEKDSLNPAEILNDFDLQKYIFNRGNVGVGLDLGIQYRFSPRLKVSASVLDLSLKKIRWKENIQNIQLNGQFTFPEHLVKVVVDAWGNRILSKKIIQTSLADSISYLLDNNQINHSNFSTPLPVTFYAGIHYQINPKLGIGVVNRTISSKGFILNSFSMIADYEMNKRFSFTTGYSILGDASLNIPLGIFYKWRSGQFFVAGDNALLLLFPHSGDYLSFSFGSCFFLFTGRNKYKKPLDYLPYYKEKKRKPRDKQGLIPNHPDGL